MKIIAKQFPHTPISGFQPTGLVPYFDEHTQCEVELSAVKGYTRVVQGFQGIGFVMNIVTVDSATCIDISIVSFLNE